MSYLRKCPTYRKKKIKGYINCTLVYSHLSNTASSAVIVMNQICPLINGLQVLFWRKVIIIFYLRNHSCSMVQEFRGCFLYLSFFTHRNDSKNNSSILKKKRKEKRLSSVTAVFLVRERALLSALCLGWCLKLQQTLELLVTISFVSPLIGKKNSFQKNYFCYRCVDVNLQLQSCFQERICESEIVRKLQEKAGRRNKTQGGAAEGNNT